MTTGREIVRQTLAYEHPERVAHSFAPSDILQVDVALPEGEWQPLADGRWERVDGWGNVWGRVDPTSKGEVIRGALESLDDVETFPLPDFSDPAVYDEARRRFAEAPDVWHAGFIHGFSFSMARKLRKLDQYFMDIMLEQEKVAVLHDRIDAAIKQQIKGMADAGADCIFFAEDWGTQTGLFIRPELWRQEFKPRFADLCGYAHDLGLPVFMHSCGKITDVVPDLIEVGVQAFQFDQPTVHTLETLADFQREHQITIWSPVDIQKVLPGGDEAAIRAEARRMLDVLWRGEGGLIAGCYPDPPSIGLEPAWQDYASDEFARHGRGEVYATA